MTPDQSIAKTRLRNKLRKQRANAAKSLSIKATKNLQQVLPRIRSYRMAKQIGLYLPFNHEFPVSPILRRNLQLAKKSYIPKITSVRKSSMVFIKLSDTSSKAILHKKKHSTKHFKKNSFGIAECRASSTKKEANSLDIVFVPLLGFTLEGQRLGMGGGYYDRIFKFKRWQNRIKKPYLIGLAYETQLLSHPHNDPWDIPVDAVITEENYYHCKTALL